MSRSECPKCGANRGIQTNTNGRYCHAGCGWIDRLRSFAAYRDSRLKVTAKDFDFYDYRTEQIELYFARKGITQETLDKFSVGCAADNRYAIPKYDEYGEIEYVYAKYISGDHHPKHFIAGLKKPFLYKKPGASVLVLVEDLESLMKLSTHTSVCALMGTQTKKDTNYLEEFQTSPFYPIKIWLDGDKSGYMGAKRLANNLMWDFHDVEIIQTPSDPKDYTDREITEILNATEDYERS